MSRQKLSDLSEDEERLIEASSNGDANVITNLLTNPSIRVNCLDKSGMTPLHHAAFKGNVDIVNLLLANGADVNSDYHDQGYSILMMGAISGNMDVTRALLEAGAKTSRENKVGRSATQMAAFVGQHHCVSLINNFFSREELDYYCVPRGLETEPKLPPALSDSVYKLILNSNLNPVRIALYLQKHPQLLQNSKIITKLFEVLCERMMKRSHTNEIMAMKFHYIGVVINEATKIYEKQDEDLSAWIKSLIKPRDDGCFEITEKLIRFALSSFPYAESQLLQQLVRQLYKVKLGGPPTALSVLTSGINGQRFASDEDCECECCGELKTKNKCSACKMVNYCNLECQKLQWFVHKKQCKELYEMYKRKIEMEKQEKEAEEREKTKKEEENAVIKNEDEKKIVDRDSVINCDESNKEIVDKDLELNCNKDIDENLNDGIIKLLKDDLNEIELEMKS